VIRLLNIEDFDALVDVMSRSFRDYPVMQWVGSGARSEYDPANHELNRFFVRARFVRGEVPIGYWHGGVLAGGALVSRPDWKGDYPDLEKERKELWSMLGPDAKARYLAFGRASDFFSTYGPHQHLNMLGVLPGYQGQGIARSLVARVEQLARETPETSGVSLTTEDPRNISLYEHLGYTCIGERPVGLEGEKPSFTTWGFYKSLM